LNLEPAAPLAPDLRALLAACRSAPADDTPRLILADWLDENADDAGISPDDARARAELIRVQVDLARPTYHTAHVAMLRAAEARLLTAHVPDWLGDLGPKLWETRRKQEFGFAAHLAAARPVPPLNPLATSSGWRFERGLLTVYLNPSELTDPEFLAWFASPLAVWVEQVAVRVGGPDELERLPVPASLRPVVGVACSIGGPSARSMQIGEPGALTAERCRAVIGSANFSLVRVLTLHPTAVEAGALAALCESDASGLRRFTIHAPLSDTDAGFLAESALDGLSALDVSGCDLGPVGFARLVHSPHLRQLTSLVAFRNRFGCEGLIALAASPLAGRLTVLEIQNTGVSDRGVSALAESALLERLIGPGLNLSMNPISDAGAKALAGCAHLAPFTELILRECLIGDGGAKALASSRFVGALAYLDLWKNRIGDAGARALARSPHLGFIRNLSMRDNPITATGARALRERFGDRVTV
jgi:uncharacterized protein (TIGR02996 family)